MLVKSQCLATALGEGLPPVAEARGRRGVASDRVGDPH